MGQSIKFLMQKSGSDVVYYPVRKETESEAAKPSESVKTEEQPATTEAVQAATSADSTTQITTAAGQKEAQPTAVDKQKSATAKLVTELRDW